MEEIDRIITLYNKLHQTLLKAKANIWTYNLSVLAGMVVLIVIGIWFELYEGYVFLASIVAYLLIFEIIYANIFGDPIKKAIDEYTAEIKKRNLSGDELIVMKAFPTRQDLSNFSSYRWDSKKDLIQKLYAPLIVLKFTHELDKIEDSYRDTVKLIYAQQSTIK